MMMAPVLFVLCVTTPVRTVLDQREEHAFPAKIPALEPSTLIHVFAMPATMTAEHRHVPHVTTHAALQAAMVQATTDA